MRKTKKSDYALALSVISKIIDDLENRGLHYRDTQGRPLFTLDQVVVAILQNRLTVLPG